jgi:hypothetical protein
VVQNIHLYPDLVNEILNQLQVDQKDFGNEFRLWMIGYASSQYSPMALQFCKYLLGMFHMDGYKHIHNSRNYIKHFVSQVSKLFVNRLFVFVTAFWKFSVWILFTISPVRGLHRPKRVSNQLIHPNWRKRTSSSAVNLGGEFLSLYSVFTLCFWRETATRTLDFPA